MNGVANVASWLERFFLVAASGTLLFLFLTISNVEIQDSDLWRHKAAGEWILSHGRVPTTDIFSCTVAGRPWHDQEWLFQVMIASVWLKFGPDPLIFLQKIIFGCILCLVASFYWKSIPHSLRLLGLLAVVLTLPLRLTLRPDMISLLMTVVFLRLLDGYADRRWVGPVLVLCQLVWANTHGFFILGVGLTALWFLCQVCSQKSLPSGFHRRWLLIIGLQILASLVNPLDKLQTYVYPFFIILSSHSAKGPTFYHDIEELANPLFVGNIHTLDFLVYRVLILLNIGGLFILWRKKDWFAICISIFGFSFSLLGIRNIPYFAILGVWVALRCASYLKLNVKGIFAIALYLWMGGWVYQQIIDVSGRGYGDPLTGKFRSIYSGGISSKVYPVGAVDFLRQKKIKGNFFNDASSGAYLIGRGYPDIRVFIDCRTELYEGDFYKNYREIFFNGNRQLFDQAVDRYDLTGVFLMTTDRHAPTAFLRMIFAHPGFQIAYFDADGIVLLRKSAGNEKLLASLGTLEDMEAAAFRRDNGHSWGDARTFLSRAYNLEILGKLGLAEVEMERVLAIGPRSFDALMLMGTIFRSKGQYAQALPWFQAALQTSPGNAVARYNLGLCYQASRQYEQASAVFAELVRDFPVDPMWKWALARNALLQGRPDEAWTIAVGLSTTQDLNVWTIIMQMANVYFQNNNRDRAAILYQRLLGAGCTAPVIRVRLDLLTP